MGHTKNKPHLIASGLFFARPVPRRSPLGDQWNGFTKLFHFVIFVSFVARLIPSPISLISL